MEHQTTPRIGYRKDKEKSYRKEKGKEIEDNLKLYTPKPMVCYLRKRLDIKKKKS